MLASFFANCAASAYVAAARRLHIAPWASTAIFLLRNAAHAVVRGFIDRTLVEACVLTCTSSFS